ncbi:MAG: hypothetical protein JO353_09085 [Phycisphaerae bacterium]|nr:hypothetical protein [Phycisphaerae bacterium]
MATGYDYRLERAIVDLLKSVAGKLVTGAVALAVIAGAIAWFQASPDVRSEWIGGAGKAVAWLGTVLVVPWIGFALVGWVARMESNAAAAVLVGSLALLEALALAWLFNWHVHGGTAWAFFVLSVLFAAAYNLFACDWIAEKV